ncbi:hypothetical protein DM01DRAFT_1383406 [Hesseltinella vesiculosa]|uniref:Uncharacterized protein n=1 Tax=Hesseltinella vesiculosa TaxID=101127 RepID=A0A1X2GHI1_9FUNG|nr:hypothetical protein DM01DRAFT_1383406 [Hesseltinella vesiculosa]
MKTIVLEYISKKFDDQYTFDLQGYLTYQGFCSNIKLINQRVKQHSMARYQHYLVSLLWLLWMGSACLFYLIATHDAPLWLMILLPVIILVLTVSFIAYYQRRLYKFEASTVEACQQINEVESMRGIEYSLLRNKAVCEQPTFSWLFLMGFQSCYEIQIQFDDRYDQRYSKDFVCVPLHSTTSSEDTDEMVLPIESVLDEKVALFAA